MGKITSYDTKKKEERVKHIIRRKEFLFTIFEGSKEKKKKGRKRIDF